MGLRARVTTTLSAVLGAALLMSSPAYAGHPDRPPPAGGEHPTVVSDSGWQALDSTKGEVFSQDACGTTLKITILADQVQSREIVYQNGDTKTNFRGKYVIQVAAPNGNKIKLDDSGKYTEVDYATNAIYLNLFGPAVIFPFTPGEAEAFSRAGLPPAFFYDHGRLEEYIVDDTHTVIYHQPQHVTNLCTSLGLKA